jgi:hypothetical protein
VKAIDADVRVETLDGTFVFEKPTYTINLFLTLNK